MRLLRCLLHLKRLGRKILLLYIILHHIYLHILGMIPHSQVTSIGFSGDETHHEPTSTSHVRYGMPDIPTHDLAHHVESEVEPSTMPGGTPIPFHMEIFGRTSHIAPSIPVVEATSHVCPRPSFSNHMWYQN